MENKYIQKIIANPNPDTLVPIWVPVPGSPGLYQQAYAPKGSFNLGYLRLSFNVTQSGTDAPVVDILLNEVGVVFTPEYDSVGNYILNWNLNVSDLTKVQLFPPTTTSVGILIATVGALRFIIQTVDTSGGNTDDLLLNSSFELRFYPGWDA